MRKYLMLPERSSGKCLARNERKLTSKVRAAAKYAIRGATMSGKVTDFDPDALVQNLLLALLGSASSLTPR